MVTSIYGFVSSSIFVSLLQKQKTLTTFRRF